MKPHLIILPTIVIAQFLCTSLWFAGNAVMDSLIIDFSLSDHALGHLTTAVQAGFITGTLTFAILTVADRFSPSKVFFVSAVFAALFNLGTIWEGNGLSSLLLFRFFTGFFLAGIYPVGMKIAADYYEKGLGKALGFLVGALVIGTAFPHLLKGFTTTLPWHLVLVGTSLLAIIGGLSMLVMVPNGPFREPAQKLAPSAFFQVFQNQKFRSAAFGYFGHMWELYAFWAFVPIILEMYQHQYQTALNTSLWSFLIIAVGGIACVLAGYLSIRRGPKQTALLALLLSGSCCLISPFVFANDSEILLIVFLLVWGMTVVADSPLFSTLIAQNVSPEIKGTALTIVNCIGFAITIMSIQIVSSIRLITDSSNVYLVLAIGPVLGIFALLLPSKTKQAQSN